MKPVEEAVSEETQLSVEPVKLSESVILIEPLEEEIIVPVKDPIIEEQVQTIVPEVSNKTTSISISDDDMEEKIKEIISKIKKY